MTASHSAPAAGMLLGGRYELTKPIASGGMAQVWEATDRVLGRTVAAKVLHPHLAVDSAFHRRFQREAVAAARLSHPAIVSIYDSVSEDGIEAIIMELVAGTTLREALDQRGRLPGNDVLAIADQVTQALQAAHQAGVVHRDIKPSNILLCPDRRVRVTDFGIAKAGEDTDLTQTGVLLGTAKYLSPEQVRGDDVDPRADLYALGVVIFEALTGGPPFDAGSDYATAQARLFNPAPHLSQIRPDLPGELDQLISRMLQRDPDRRPATAAEVQALLSGITIESEDLTGAPFSPADHTNALQPTDTRSQSLSGAAKRPTGEMPTSPPTYAPAPGPLSSEARPTDLEILDGEEDESNSGFLSWLVPVLLLSLVGGSLVLVGILVTRSPLGPDSDPGSANNSDFGVGSSSETVPPNNAQTFVPPVIVAVTPFDPDGDGTELDELAPLAIDGSRDTAWSTELYRKPNFSDLKPGVGLVIQLESPSSISSLQIITPSSAWAAEVYFADALPGDRAGWGATPAHQVGPLNGSAFIEAAPDQTAQFVLIWITDHGVSNDGPDDAPYADANADPDNRMEIAEVILE